MSDIAHCDECRKFFEEVKEAASAEIEDFSRIKDALGSEGGKVFLGLILGAEEDPERTDEVLKNFQFRPELSGSPAKAPMPRCPGTLAVLRKVFEHQKHTGHMALFFK